MKTCPKCKRTYEERLPFCFTCEGFVLIDYYTHLNVIILTYQKRP